MWVSSFFPGQVHPPRETGCSTYEGPCHQVRPGTSRTNLQGGHRGGGGGHQQWVLARYGLNIGRFDLRRSPKGGKGVMIIELDSEVDEHVNEEIKAMKNVIDSTLLKAI